MYRLHLLLLITSSVGHRFRHVAVNLPQLAGTGLIGDGAPQIDSTLSNPYTYGSPYGMSFSGRDTVGYGTFMNKGYGPMGAFNGYGTYPGTEQRDAIQGNPGFASTAWNYSSPWGDSAHPGVHPMWPIPPSPYGMKENDPRTVGLQSWNQSNGVMVSNFTRFGMGGVNSFSPYRKYKYTLGEIPSDWSMKYNNGNSRSANGEPVPFRNMGVIPSTVPEGMERSSAMQRKAANAIMPMGSTVDQVKGRGEGVMWPFGTGSESADATSLLELEHHRSSWRTSSWRTSAYRQKRNQMRGHLER
jgi:hypothetical protein